MAHIIPMAVINQFLPNEKLSLDADPAPGVVAVDHYKVQELEETARDVVVARLSYRIYTDPWFVSGPIPSLIENVMGMLVAAWVYDRQFAEESTEGATYGKHREAEAYRILDGILEGKYKLVDGQYINDPSRLPSVYDTGEPKFTMGQLF